MSNKFTQGSGQPPVTEVEDARPQPRDQRNAWRDGAEAYPGGGVNGPIKEDRADYEGHYGEARYAKGERRHKGATPASQVHVNQTVHGGQQGVLGGADAEDKESAAAHREGHAGSRGMVPGAGADKGPKDRT